MYLFFLSKFKTENHLLKVRNFAEQKMFFQLTLYLQQLMLKGRCKNENHLLKSGNVEEVGQFKTENHLLKVGNFEERGSKG